ELRIQPAVIVLSSADEALISAVATMVDALGFPLLGAFRKPLAPQDLGEALEKLLLPGHSSDATVTEPQLPDVRQLRLALEQRAIKPHFQPKLDLQMGCLAGVEALARWQVSPGQFIPPGIFIPLAD